MPPGLTSKHTNKEANRLVKTLTVSWQVHRTKKTSQQRLRTQVTTQPNQPVVTLFCSNHTRPSTPKKKRKDSLGVVRELASEKDREKHLAEALYTGHNAAKLNCVNTLLF